MKKKVLLSWSSGKDSAWALHLLRQQSGYEIAGLLTTINSEFDRVAMHSTRRVLVEMQARAAGLPIRLAPLPWPCSNLQYQEIMRHECEHAIAAGVQAIAFGDLFLRDIRAYREKQLQGTGLEPLFPVWGIPTGDLAREMVRAGVQAKLVCGDPAKLPADFAGRDFNESLLADLPPGVDPCGENGEFHTFAYAGPMFSHPLAVICGERVERDGFWFCDLSPQAGAAEAR